MRRWITQWRGWGRLLSLVFFLGMAIPFSALGGEEGPPKASPRQEDQKGPNPGAWLIGFFRDHISPIDGDRCPSLPSCSAFSQMAFQKHGFLLGWMMTVDRLIHEGGEETRVSPVVYHQGRWRIFDPVENNDFWWSRE